MLAIASVNEGETVRAGRLLKLSNGFVNKYASTPQVGETSYRC